MQNKFTSWAIFILGLLLLFVPAQLWGQFDFEEPIADTSENRIIIDSTEVIRFNEGVKELVGDVHLRQKDALMFCDSAIIQDNNVRAYGDVLIVQNDSVYIYSDSLYYWGDERQASLFGDVVLTDSLQKLFTNRLDYDMDARVGTYKNGATLESGTTKLESKIGYYYVDENEAYFKDQVVLIDTNYTLRSDTLRVNTETNIAYFLGPTNIQTKENEVYCEAGFYDTEKNYAEFEKNVRFVKDGQIATADKVRYDGNLDQAYMEGRSVIQNDGQTIYADDVFYDSGKGMSVLRNNVVVEDSDRIIYADSLDYSNNEKTGLARGNVVLVDKVQDYVIECERADYDESAGYLKASGRPFMQTILDQDTLWLAADTLLSYKSETIDSSRTLVANQNVRMYKNDLQAVCDSLVYSDADSIFYFYKNPILWSDTTQFTADTISVFMKSNLVHRIDMIHNSLILNTKDSIYFNQIKGRDILVRFKENEVRSMRVEGNGESVYYMLDDNNAYAGVNKTICSEMLIYFGDNQVNRINFYAQPKATVYPMGQVSHKNIRLAGFDWKEKQRPKSRYDLRFFEIKK